MSQNINVEKIMAIHRRHGELQFNMALQHLFDSGKLGFTEETVADAKNSIRENTPKNSFMTVDFQVELLDISYELSKFPTWDILLYVKLYISIQDDNLARLEEAERALSNWSSQSAPKSWEAAVADPDSRHDILMEMVKYHNSEYTRSEIEAAIHYVAEEN